MGHNEEPASYVARTAFERREQSRFDCKAQRLKVPENRIGSQGHMAFDVLEEAPFGIELLGDSPDVRPEVAGIVFPLAAAGEAEGLAGISGSEDMNLSTPWRAVEGGNVIPDRSLIQGLVFHPCHESGRREGFPLDVTNSSIALFCDVEAEFEAADAGAKRDAAEIISGGM